MKNMHGTAPVVLGQHLLAELCEADAGHLADAVLVESVLRSAAEAAQATVLFAHVHHFGEGQGVTGVLLLSESHISIHTWPEHGYAAVDVFMCGSAYPERAVTVLAEGLAAKKVSVQACLRGASLAG